MNLAQWYNLGLWTWKWLVRVLLLPNLFFAIFLQFGSPRAVRGSIPGRKWTVYGSLRQPWDPFIQKQCKKLHTTMIMGTSGNRRKLVIHLVFCTFTYYKNGKSWIFSNSLVQIRKYSFRGLFSSQQCPLNTPHVPNFQPLYPPRFAQCGSIYVIWGDLMEI